MLRKLTLALVAAASLSALALAPTAASAHLPGWGGGWGGGYHHFGWGHRYGFGGGYAGDCYAIVETPYGPRRICTY
jgi:Spy/CpxP family protein refolding chaperone